MESFLRLILLTSLLWGRLSVYGMVPLLRNLPSEATSSTAKVEPEAIEVNRFTFTAPEDIPTAMNEMGIRMSREAEKNPRARHRQDDLHSSAKRIKIEPINGSQELNFRYKGTDISTHDFTKSVPSARVVPYSFFFQSSAKMAKMTTVDQYIIKLAGIIQTFISKLNAASQPWGMWIHENQSLALECFSTAHAALHRGNLGECERLWVLGIVAALVKNLPSISTDIVNRLQHAPWKHHSYLEIQAAIGLEECFSRARLFESHDEIRTKYFPAKRSSIDKFVSENLLNVKIPEEDSSIKSMIRSFASYFKHLEIPSWEGTYGKAIFIYLMKNWQNVYPKDSNTLLEWIEMDFNLYRDLHLPFFKADIKSILRTTGITSNYIKYDEMIDPSRPLRAPILERIFSFGGHHEIPNSLEGSLYKLAVIASLIHPSLKDMVIQGIDQNPRIVQRLAPVWSEMYHALEVGIHEFFDYHYMPFKQRPNYLAMAHRHLLSGNLFKFSETESLGMSLQRVPLHVSKLDPSLVTRILSEVKKILYTHIERNELPKVYLMVLEVIQHLLKYSPGSSQILLKQLDKDIEFRETLYHSIGHVLESKIFDDHVAIIDECALAYEIEDVLISLQEILSPGTVWQWGEVSKNKGHIDKYAKILEEELSPYSGLEIGDLPDPREESLKWLQR
ncbi:uncharacterized protein MELLADRAFT_106706 [Melampsora larici-populina 98AG31]|uniref:Secreted protein n=1 Tax=Melampsora larici-populina (strain 98AG31 / pathotype 3-4-7) TaxID=747676 RepID=F4RMD3_MELLP|nr:uncharacterized protein MELLADRAFT_106706 [Melampsora larici-populina 98AG31]EGG06409.1 hypothetical protein MELLADRAFT_106706 [Melampsora larici-populina 98AG31]